ncbi:MAG: hypothetical protein Q8M92_01250 [Candidatus Subteraquimicrobiales bacterium]|nr:hypothetical protein [Candidatus Subteraquimicrobiales bacterium]
METWRIVVKRRDDDVLTIVGDYGVIENRTPDTEKMELHYFDDINEAIEEAENRVKKMLKKTPRANIRWEIYERVM